MDLKKLKNLPTYGHPESAHVRFDWLFNKRVHGHVYIARLYEAGIVNYRVVIDSRRCPRLICDSCDPYPLILYSSSLFQCGGPDADKVQIIQLYKVIHNRRSGEKTKDLKRKLL